MTEKEKKLNKLLNEQQKTYKKWSEKGNKAEDHSFRENYKFSTYITDTKLEISEIKIDILEERINRIVKDINENNKDIIKYIEEIKKKEKDGIKK